MRVKTGLIILLAVSMLLACSTVEALLSPTQAPVLKPVLATESGQLPGQQQAVPERLEPAETVQGRTETTVEEAILILEPGPGSRILSPLHVAGWADPAFEQTLLIRVLQTDGSQLMEEPVQIESGPGQRGPFAADLPFSVTEPENVLIQVLDLSARDGGIVHLASVSVILQAEGDEVLVQGAAADEQLQILNPEPGETIQGGLVLVEGYGLASFENTLVVEVYDAEGVMAGSAPCMTAAQEPGETGYFSVEVEYNVSQEGPGRISVVDTLPVFDGIGHVASVPVSLAP